MPDDIKERLKAFVPPPVEAKIETLAEIPAVYHLPYTRWNAKARTEEKGTEEVPKGARRAGRQDDPDPLGASWRSATSPVCFWSTPPRLV